MKKVVIILLALLLMGGGIALLIYFGYNHSGDNLDQNDGVSSGGSQGGGGGGDSGGGSDGGSNNGGTNAPNVVISESDITFLLSGIGASSLHNPPLSSNTPKIEVIADGTVFNSEVVKGEIITRRGSSNDPDIRVRTSGAEIAEARKAADVKSFIKNSVVEGRTSIEQIASKTELFTKGYLDIYNEFK